MSNKEMKEKWVSFFGFNEQNFKELENYGFQVLFEQTDLNTVQIKLIIKKNKHFVWQVYEPYELDSFLKGIELAELIYR